MSNGYGAYGSGGNVHDEWGEHGTVAEPQDPLERDGVEGPRSHGEFVREWGVVGNMAPRFIDIPGLPPGDPPPAALYSNNLTGGPPWISVDSLGNLYVYGQLVSGSRGAGLVPSGDTTGVTDTANLQAAINAFAGGGGTITFSAGTYYIAKITMATGVHLVGTGWVSCTIITKDAWLFNLDNANGILENVEITGFTITGKNGTAADFFYGSNMVRSRFTDNFFWQTDINHAIFNCSPATGLGNTYLAESYFSNKEQTDGTGRTIEAWHLDMEGPSACNDNQWVFGGNKIWPPIDIFWMYLTGAISGSTGSRHNKFSGLIFEQSGGRGGGLIHVQNATNLIIEDISMEDLASTVPVNPMILLDTNGSPGGCQDVVIRNYHRRGGGGISTTFPDIKMDANASNVEIDTLTNSSGGTAPIVDLGTAQNVRLTGVWLGSVTILNGDYANQRTTNQALSNGSGIQNINPAAYRILTLTSSGNVTGITMPVGSYGGQAVTLVNEGANSITFDVSGTSRVADGASDVIATLTAATYVWDILTSLWYRSV